MKKILKYILIAIVGIVLALAVAPFVFKKQILELVKTTINENLNAEVSFSDVDLSLLRSFPDATVTIYDLAIVGVDTFYQVPLFKASEVVLETNVTPLFNKSVKPSIHYLKAKDADINIVVMRAGLANYLITKPNPSDSSQYEIKLDGYEIENGKLSYEDKEMDLLLTLLHTNHKGSGKLSTDIFDLDTETAVDSLTLTFAGIDYIDAANANLEAKINVNLPTETYTLKENKLRINELDASGEGYLQFVPEGIKMVFDLMTPNEQFRDIVSALPIIKYDKNMKVSGTANLVAKIDGIYNGDNGTFPAFDLQLGIGNGALQYPDLPYPIKNINGDIKVKSTTKNMSDLSINIPAFALELNNEKVNGRLMLSQALGNGLVDGALKGKISLQNWKAALPLEGVETLNGKIASDVSFKGKMSDIESQNYNAIQFSGDFTAQDIQYKSKGMPAISLASGVLKASPATLDITTTGLKPGKSDLAFSGSIANPLAVFTQNGAIDGVLTLKGSLLDINEWQSSEPTNGSSASSSPSLTNLDNYKASNVKLDIDIKKVLFGDMILDNLQTKSNIGFNHAEVKSFSVVHDGNDVHMTGLISNVYDYLFNNGVLEGKLAFDSKYFDANKYMAAENQQTQTSGTIVIPKNINLAIDANLSKVKYTNLDFTNMSGTINVANSQITMQNVTTQMLGGDVGFEGFYKTIDKEPEYSIKLDLAKLKIKDAFDQFNTMQVLAPIAKYMSGVFNTTLVMDGKLGSDMMPVFSTLNASGFLETFSSALSNMKIFEILSEQLGLEQLKKVNLENTKNWFDVQQGYVELKEKVFNIDNIGMKISGKHQIQGPMEYALTMKIPRVLFDKNKVTAAANKGWSWLEKEAAKRGVDVAQGEFIDVKVDIGGTLASPTFKITPMGASGKTIQEEIKDEVKDQINQMVDSVKTVLDDKKEKLKDTIMTRAEQEVDKLKDKAKDEINTKGKEVIGDAKDIITKELETRVDSTLGAGVTDSLKIKAAQILKEKTGTEVEDIKKKLDDFNPFKKKKPGSL